MADTLTQLIAKVQAQLMDNGTLFTTPTCTAAIRQALAAINAAVPDSQTVLIDSVASQLEYELTDADPQATGMQSLYLQGDNEADTALAYDAYIEDERWFFRLRFAQPAGKVLIAHYVKPFTISGLDSATDSTLSDRLNVAAIDGGTMYACLIRAGATIESNNVQQGVSVNWLKTSETWSHIFQVDLGDYHQKPGVKAEPTTYGAWNDNQHSDFYP